MPRDTSTRRRPGSSRCQGKPGEGGRAPKAGPTKAWCGGKSAADPTSSGVEKTSTSRSENRGSQPTGSRAAPYSASRPEICPATHSPTFGKSAKGRVSSADVLADVAHGAPSRRATSGPARACWSATSTSGPKARTARVTPGTMARASGTRASSHRNRSAPTPRRSRQRSCSAG